MCTLQKSINSTTSGGGVMRLWRLAMPAAFATVVALMLLSGMFEATMQHDAEWVIALLLGGRHDVSLAEKQAADLFTVGEVTGEVRGGRLQRIEGDAVVDHSPDQVHVFAGADSMADSRGFEVCEHVTDVFGAEELASVGD